MKEYNWGILGTGWIAHEMGEALNAVNGEIYAVCDTTLEGAEKYAKEFGVKKAYGSADEMIADENVDIVYIATPHSLHYRFLLQAVKAGKHVFCEKSITVNSRQLEECVAIAQEKGLVICDGVTLLHMPLYKKLKEIVESGVIGDVKMVQVKKDSSKFASTQEQRKRQSLTQKTDTQKKSQQENPIRHYSTKYRIWKHTSPTEPEVTTFRLSVT